GEGGTEEREEGEPDAGRTGPPPGRPAGGCGWHEGSPIGRCRASRPWVWGADRQSRSVSSTTKCTTRPRRAPRNPPTGDGEQGERSERPVHLGLSSPVIRRGRTPRAGGGVRLTDRLEQLDERSAVVQERGHERVRPVDQVGGDHARPLIVILPRVVHLPVDGTPLQQACLEGNLDGRLAAPHVPVLIPTCHGAPRGG